MAIGVRQGHKLGLEKGVLLQQGRHICLPPRMSRRSLREIPDTVLPWRLSSLQQRVRLLQARNLGPAGVQLGLEIALCVFEGSNLGKGGLEIDLKLVGLGRGVGARKRART